MIRLPISVLKNCKAFDKASIDLVLFLYDILYNCIDVFLLFAHQKKKIAVFPYAEDFSFTMFFLRMNMYVDAKILLDITVVDRPWKKRNRFEISYFLLSPHTNNRIIVRIFSGGINPVPSVCHLYKSSNWLEREIWDLFGIPFSSHPDLRRLLSDYGFKGHPLRKTFPVTGFVEIYYDDSHKNLVMGPSLNVHYMRYYDFDNAWENLASY